MDLFVSDILNDKCLRRLFKWLNARFSLKAARKFLPRLAAWPTPLGCTVNCAPVRRSRVSTSYFCCPVKKHIAGSQYL